jgi:hypothetical protein
MARRRQLLEHREHGRRQDPQALELALVSRQLRSIRQRFVNQQVGDLLELALGCDVENVVTAIVQIVACPAHRAERGVPGRHP